MAYLYLGIAIVAEVRSGLRHLEVQPSWEMVAEGSDGKEAIERALETILDVAVIDYSMPLVNGVEATSRYARPRAFPW